jgi:hypothetical protein
MTMKNAIIAVAILAAGALLAHLHVAAQIYYPVAQLTSPDGLIFTAVQDETDERRECGKANERFLAPFKSLCKQCQIVFARCERALTGLEAELASGQPLPHHQVLSPGLRLAVAGPDPQAKQTCDFIAADMVKRGYRATVCVAPKSGAPDPK